MAAIPCRAVLCVMIAIGAVLYSSQANSLSVTIVAMVNKELWKEDTLISDECIAISSRGTKDNSTAHITGEFEWDPYTQGLILGASSYASLFTSLLGGYLAIRFGGKWVYGLGFLGLSVLSCLTPVAARAGVPFMILVRVLCGFPEGAIISALAALIGHWAPNKERAVFCSVVAACNYAGIGLVSVYSGYVSANPSLGWPYVFYSTGALSLLFFSIWVFLGFSTPAEHPRISAKELFYIQESLGNYERTSVVPLRSILLSVPFWAAVVVSTTFMWFSVTFVSSMPLYLDTVLRIPIENNGLFIGLNYTSNVLGSLVGGIVSDVLLRRFPERITTIRKGVSLYAFSVACLCYLCIPLFGGCDMTSVFALMFLAQFSIALNVGGSLVVLIDMSPKHTGFLHGISHSVSGATGFLAPLVTGTFLKDDVTRESWVYVVSTCCVVALSGLVVFLIFGSAETQSQWDNDHPDQEEKRRLIQRKA